MSAYDLLARRATGHRDPSVPTLPLLPYQEVGAAFLASKERCGLWDEMGVGKTAQAVAALDLIDAKRAIIVAPAGVHKAGVWQGEFRKFLKTPRRVLKGRDANDITLWLRGRADYLLLSYEAATRWGPKLGTDLFDALVCDESHYLKAPQSARTKALFGPQCDGVHGLARWAAHAWFLSGTPMPNDPADIWPWLRFVGGTPLTLAPFKARYFRARQGAFSQRHEPLEKAAPELRQAIRAFSLRRTKAEAGLQLPPIWLTTQALDGDTAEIRRLLREFPGLEKAVVEAVDAGGLSFLDAQHVGTLRRLVGEAKAPAFAELLVEELHGGLDKAVVFGIHVRALTIVAEWLRHQGIGCVHVDGSSSEKQRTSAVERFQQDPDCRVFVGNLRAAGTGLTLTAAAEVIMLEQSWSPADNAQALMRVHRIGQTRQVRARFISLAGSIDETVAQVVADKTRAIAKIENAA